MIKYKVTYIRILNEHNQTKSIEVYSSVKVSPTYSSGLGSTRLRYPVLIYELSCSHLGSASYESKDIDTVLFMSAVGTIPGEFISRRWSMKRGLRLGNSGSSLELNSGLGRYTCGTEVLARLGALSIW